MGETGLTSLSGTYYDTFCAGNNNGYYYSSRPMDTGDQNSYGVKHHHETADVFKHVYIVDNNSYSGSEKCAF